MKPDIPSVAVPPTSEADWGAKSELKAETAMESEPVAAPGKSEPTGAPNAETAKSETAKSQAAEFEAITCETEALHGIPQVPAAEVEARIGAQSDVPAETEAAVSSISDW